MHTHARHGDADSTEKLSRRLQDIQAKGDALKDTLEESRLREELQSEVKALNALMGVANCQEHLPHATRLKEWASNILRISPFDKAGAKQGIDEISNCHFRIASEHDEFWVAQLGYLIEGHVNGDVKFNDSATVAGLLKVIQ